MDELKKAKLKRFIARICFFLIDIVLPTALMITHFELTKVHTRSLTIVTFYGFIVCFIIFTLIWKFKAQLKAWIESWEYSYMKYIFLGLSKVWIYILLLIVVLSTHATLIDATNNFANAVKESVAKVYEVIEYCMIVVCATQCVAYLIIYPIENKYDYQVKRLIRKRERKEDYKEAMKEE